MTWLPQGPRRALAVACALGMCVLASHVHAQNAVHPISPSVVDLHVDLAFALHVRGRRVDDDSAETSAGRLRQGGVATLVLPLYVPSAHDRPSEEVRAVYESTHATLMGALRTGPFGDLFLPPAQPEQRGRISTVLAFEGADGFADDPNLLVPWIARGACLVGLVHFRTNALAGSSTEPASAKRAQGLTDAGELIVRTAYSHGALVDVAHASDETLRQVARVAKDFGAPLVDSHTGMRALKAIDRNLSDEGLALIAESGGVVGIDLHAGHTGSRRGMASTLDDVVAHVEHAVAVAGLEHVALGSDLDGGIVQPQGADGAAVWPKLAAKLRARGWSQEAIAALFGDNARRVLGWSRHRGCGQAGR